jgi:putative addiction module component (TIGR02574 family)
MSTVVEKIKSELAELTTSERAHVAEFLLESLTDDDAADIEAAWDAELERRAEMIRSGTARAEPAEKVFAELRKRFE